MKEIDRFIKRELADVLNEVGNRRETISPLYGWHTKFLLLLGLFVLILEVLYLRLIANRRVILFTPVVIMTLLPFRLIFKRIRLGYSVSSFQAEFLDEVDAAVVVFLIPEHTYSPLCEPDSDLLVDSGVVARPEVAEEKLRVVVIEQMNELTAQFILLSTSTRSNGSFTASSNRRTTATSKRTRSFATRAPVGFSTAPQKSATRNRLLWSTRTGGSFRDDGSDCDLCTDRRKE